MNNKKKDHQPLRAEMVDVQKKIVPQGYDVHTHFIKFVENFTSVNLSEINLRKKVGDNYEKISDKLILKLVYLGENDNCRQLSGQNAFPQIIANVLGKKEGICFFQSREPCLLSAQEFASYSFIDGVFSLVPGSLGLTRTHHDDLFIWASDKSVFESKAWAKPL